MPWLYSSILAGWDLGIEMVDNQTLIDVKC